MAKRGKNYQQKVSDVDSEKAYGLDEGLELTLKSKFAKFDESLDIAVRLGVDPRHAEQMVRSSIVLPNGTGKTERVLVFAKGEKVQEALDALPSGGGKLYITTRRDALESDHFGSLANITVPTSVLRDISDKDLLFFQRRLTHQSLAGFVLVR